MALDRSDDERAALAPAPSTRIMSAMDDIPIRREIAKALEWPLGSKSAMSL